MLSHPNVITSPRLPEIVFPFLVARQMLEREKEMPFAFARFEAATRVPLHWREATEHVACMS